MEKIQRIALKGLFNTRDLGGFTTREGHQVKPRRLIRSGQLAQMTEEDQRTLVEEYQLNTVIDFRTEGEQAERPDPEMRAVTYISNPILENMTAGITHDKESDRRMSLGEATLSFEKRGIDPEQYMKAMYQDIITNPYSLMQYRKFFDILSKRTKGASLWHCSAGKDRVGIGTAMLLSVLGVDMDTVLCDYMMTGIFVKEEIERMIAGLSSKIQNEGSLEAVRVCMGVKESYLLGTFETMEKMSGSVAGFLKEQIGLDEKKIETLKTLYLQ